MDYPHIVIIQVWEHSTATSPKKGTNPNHLHTREKAPFMVITTYNSRNPTSFNEIISQHWCHLQRSSAIKDIHRRKFIASYRKPPFLEDMFVRAKIPQPLSPQSGHAVDYILVNTVIKFPNLA